VWALLLLLIGILPWYHSYRAFASSGKWPACSYSAATSEQR
jgi:hypothetical protein